MSGEPFDHTNVEVERYELREPATYRFAATRREFIQVVGAGVVIAVSADWSQAQQRRFGQRQARREEPLADRFHIADDGTVTVLTSKVEVGQDARTQIVQAAAEELGLPIEQVRVVMGDTERCPDDGGTAGSRTTPATVPRVRQAAAALRVLFAAHAARRLGVDREQLRLEAGVFIAGSQRVTLADLIEDEQFLAELERPPAGEVALKPIDRWQVLGTPVDMVTGHDVVTGRAQYPSDIRRPGMLYGSVLRPASFGATLESIDLSPAEAMDGVTAVRDGNFIGCTAATSWRAQRAVEAIAATARWQRPPHPSSDELFDHLKRHSNESRARANTWGDGESALATADKSLDVSYTVAYIQHAPLEPRAAVAEWRDDGLTVWTGTQQPSRVQGELSQAFRLPREQVRVIVPDTGGGFGGKHTGEVAVEAARLAKAAGRPVSLTWTREEEFTWAYFRPAGLIEVRAGLDAAGRLLAWDFTNYNSGGSAIGTPYRVPNGRTRFVATDSPLRQGSYRALASTANTFARESAMDELAALAGRDPLQFRLDHLDDDRLKDVLVAAAERFGWSKRRAAATSHRGVGLACGTEKGSFAAACAEVEVADGQIHVLSICEAFECGAIQNPRNLRAQVEGSIVMALGGALSEEIHFQDGRITNPSFSSYHVPRADDLPEIDVVLLDRRDLPSVGGGETPIIAAAPAIANALYHATGIRGRSMPLGAIAQHFRAAAE